MNLEELETNLGTIAKSGSGVFKKENEHKKDILPYNYLLYKFTFMLYHHFLALSIFKC